MRLSIKYKLFFILLLANGLAYLATYGVWYYNFNQGFRDYISRIELAQVPALIKGLEGFYREHGSWQAIIDDNNIFLDLIAHSIESSVDEDLKKARQRSIPRPVPYRSPQFTQINDWYYSSEYSPARPYLQLLDADKKVVRRTPFAPPPESASLNPILVDGKTVGYLAVTSPQQLSEQGDLLFKEQQQNDFFHWALELGLLTALLAFPAAAFLTRPARQVAEGARALTNAATSMRGRPTLDSSDFSPAL